MENILEIVNLENYQFNDIKLSNPSIQTGNNYYTSITIGDRDKPLYIQFPKCTTKAGCVKNNSKCYTDLIFSASDTKIINWLENFENYLQNEIYKKKELWFDNDIEIDDIQELMTPLLRSYRSGKNILIRCNIKNHKCSVYDENEILLGLDKFTSEKEIIPLVCVNGIKFSSKNFTIELNLTQIMILSSKDDLEKNCLIKSTIKNDKKNDKHVINHDVIKNSKKNFDIPENPDSYDNSDNYDNSNNSDNTDKLDIHDKDYLEKNINSNLTNEIIDLDKIDSIEEIHNINDDSNILLNIDDNRDDTSRQDEVDINNNDNDVINKFQQKKEENNLQQQDNNKYINDTLEKINDLDEVDLNSLSIQDEKNDNSKEINIKEPSEIYYEIYKNALFKANTLKKNTIEAFLNAKNIKLKYNLEDLDLDVEDENEDIEEVSNLN